ncbi:histamine N-methyltransferase-like isoform X4 [Limanda limanda]|uniref:histamine N-methyltransferase-like isoform X4 n=1 Tax=Limanda limanda TaxID=27771 RepID=UPI0029C7999E|nr:histamine N-methyltransferase-like isoform X4 [Limanda limanda]
MAAEAKQTCYEGSAVQSFQFYLEHSGEHEAIVQGVHSILPAQFKRIGAGKSGLDVLGVGSGGGEVDVQMLSLLQSTFPTVPITADIVEGSAELTENFKAHSGWDTLWKTFEKELCVDTIPESRSSAEVISSLKSQGLKYEEHIIQNTFDITECYDPNSTTGARLLSFMTQTKNVHQSLSQEVRAGILELLRNKCSTTPHLFTIPVSQVRAFCLIPPRLFLHLTHPGENEHIEVGQQTN